MSTNLSPEPKPEDAFQINEPSPLELNRMEVLTLLRTYVGQFSLMLQSQNSIPRRVLWEGGGPENLAGLKRINELFMLLKDYSYTGDSGE